MISRTYNIQEFIDYVKDRDLLEIKELGDREYDSAINTRSQGERKDRMSCFLKYAEHISGLLFFINCGVKPAGIPNNIFLKFRPIFENLVTKKQMLPSILDFFSGE